MKPLKSLFAVLAVGGLLGVGVAYAGYPGFQGPHPGGSPWSCDDQKAWCQPDQGAVTDEVLEFVGASPAPGTPPYNRDHPNQSDEEGSPWSGTGSRK
jgi:hypothetical protein